MMMAFSTPRSERLAAAGSGHFGNAEPILISVAFMRAKII